jgi:diadenosine tetraphosphatase ApaH/serine/threonine PP2A family protein phosphatase
MRIAVLSDVHSNLEALLSVRRFVTAEISPDAVLFLGDAVGYGPDPNECVDILREWCALLLLGNHDAAAAGLRDTSGFNAWAREAIEYTSSVLTAGNRAFLAGLPVTATRAGAVLVHASPLNPLSWDYLSSAAEATAAFCGFAGDLCFVGHTHVPAVFTLGENGTTSGEAFTGPVTLTGARWIVNAGSVGQPRDGDPRAAVLLWEEDRRVTALYRVPYDFDETRKKMALRGLPGYLAGRLALGR